MSDKPTTAFPTGAPGHRQQFIAAPTRYFANRAAPDWSFVVIQYKAGWIAFESLSDADAFRARILDERAGEPDAAPPRQRRGLKRRLPPYLP